MVINVELKKKQTIMKQTYINPELKVVKLQTQQFMMLSTLTTTDATSGNLSRDFDYEDEEEYEDY